MNASLASLDNRARSGVIGGVRVLAGLLWLANLHWKVPNAFGEDTGGGLYKYVASAAERSPFAPYSWVVREIILPNYQLFGWFTLISETALALLLLVGYRTKLVALAGAAMTVPIMLSVLYYDRADEWSWSYLLMIGVHLLLYATDAGRSAGVDGVTTMSPAAAGGALRRVGVVAVVVGVLGLYVARSVDFAGRTAALLGSDAGFVNDDGSITRRWELKFVWFNPLWAILTVVFGILLVVGASRVAAAWVGAGGFAAIAVIVFVTRTFDYARDDGAVQVVATASNAAMWGAFALAGVLLGRRSVASVSGAPGAGDRSIDAGVVAG